MNDVLLDVRGLTHCPPMFQLSPTRSAATWLLDSRAPRIEPSIGGGAHE